LLRMSNDNGVFARPFGCKDTVDPMPVQHMMRQKGKRRAKAKS